MDDDVSHAVEARLTALEEKVGIGQEGETDGEDGEDGNGDDLVEERDAQEEAD